MLERKELALEEAVVKPLVVDTGGDGGDQAGGELCAGVEVLSWREWKKNNVHTNVRKLEDDFASTTLGERERESVAR